MVGDRAEIKNESRFPTTGCTGTGYMKLLVRLLIHIYNYLNISTALVPLLSAVFWGLQWNIPRSGQRQSMEFFQNIYCHHTYSQFQFSIKIASKLACLDRMIIVLNCLLQTLSFDPLTTIVKFQPQPKCHIICYSSNLKYSIFKTKSVGPWPLSLYFS